MTDDPEAIALIEKVAKAIYEADDPWHAAWPWPNPKDGHADKIRDIARAAIAETLKAVDGEMPDDIDLFRAIRSAGRKDRDKAKAVLALMPNFAAAIQKIGHGESLQNEPGT